MNSIKLFILYLFVLSSGSLHALNDAPEFRSYPHSQARIWLSHSELSSKTKSISLALEVDLEDHWHTYWENPGDSGASPIIDVQIEGAQITEESLLYPPPVRIDTPPLTSFAYENRVVFIKKLDLAKIQGQSVKLSVEAEWLVCKVECVPAIGQYKFELAIADIEELKHQDFFKAAQAQSIKAAQSNGFFRVSGDELFFTPQLPFKVADIFISSGQGLDNAKPIVNKDEFIFKVENKTSLSELKGLAVGEDGEFFAFAAKAKESMSILLMLLFSFLGGLILNLMPCVLPVLSLKLFSLVKANEEGEGQVRMEGLAYALGAVLSFVLIAVVLVALRSAGQEIGWGFQLQSPAFVVTMAVVFFVLSLNFLGLYEINIPFLNAGSNLTRKKGFQGAFFTGVLSVLVASPCTAPFMGAAMGVALTQGTFVTLLGFFFLGLGFAFPFILFAISPSMVRVLPRPGNWMNVVKKLMFVPMFMASLWLGWVSWQLLSPTSSSIDKSSQVLPWKVFSHDALYAELEKGENAVFVNFTADWCLSCKVNEALAFNQDEVQAYVAEKRIVFFKADWTKKDAAIAKELARYGRASVPLYLYFKPGNKTPKVLPEILTSSTFLKELETE